MSALDEVPTTTPRPRRRHRLAPTDLGALAGAGVSAGALVSVLYQHVLYLSGTLGFILSWYGVFVLLYALLCSLTYSRPVVVDRVVAVILTTAAVVVVGALVSALVYTITQGAAALSHTNFLTHDMSGVSPSDPLNRGGILQAIVGTVVEVGLAVVIAVPFGVGTAVYMSEVGGRFATFVRTVVEAMTALPEILAGLFIYVMLIVGLGMPKSGLAAAVAIAVTMTPIIARASEVSLRLVPNALREASEALGATHWRTVWKVVLPSARAGLATAVILAIARGIGETAIVLITSGASSFLTFNPTSVPMNSLPLFIYTAFVSHEPAAISRAFGAATVLLAMVVVLFVAVRLLTRARGVPR